VSAHADTADLPDVRRWRRLFTVPSTWIGLVLVALVVVFGALGGANFLSLANARNLFTDASIILVVATGMTFVIISAGIDLSVGSVLVFGGVIAERAMHVVGGGV
jgi:ribose transport system permease protein